MSNTWHEAPSPLREPCFRIFFFSLLIFSVMCDELVVFGFFILVLYLITLFSYF